MSKDKKNELLKIINECIESFEFKETPEEINQEISRISKILAKKMKYTAPEYCLRTGIVIGMKIYEKGNINEKEN